MPTLVEFDVRATVHADAFPSRGVYMAARRGLRRLAETADTTPDAIEVGDPVVALRSLLEEGAVDRRGARDEISALRRLADLPSLPPDVAARVRRGEATLADAVACVRLRTDWNAEAGRIVGAVRRLSEALGTAPEAVPARLQHVDGLFGRFSAADFGVQARTYGTLKSRVRRAVALVDHEARTHLKASGLTGPWRHLHDAAKAVGTGRVRGEMVALWPLVRFCHARGLIPHAVTDAVVQDLLDHLETRGVTGAFEVARKVVYAWQGLQAGVPGWPEQRLTRLYASSASARAWPAFQDLPENIRAIWDGYAAAAGRSKLKSFADLVVDAKDEFADISAGGPIADAGGYLSEESLRARKSVWLQAVGVARDMGITVQTMSDIANIEVAKRLLGRIGVRQAAAAEAEGRTYSSRNSYRKSVATHVRMLAADSGAATDELETFGSLRDRVDPHLLTAKPDVRTGKVKRTYMKFQMGGRPAKALQQFRTPLTLLAFFQMPDRLLGAAKPLLLRPERVQEGRVLVISALCHLILRDVPLRRGDLGRLRLFGDQREIILPPGRRGGRAQIVVVVRKTGETIDMELSERTTDVLRWWLREVRPGFMQSVGAPTDCPYLFPAGGAKPFRDENTLNRGFVRHNRKHGGFGLSLHVMRHLVGKIVLDEDPTKIDLVQQMLAHRARETTERYYAQANQILAQRKVHEILGEAERIAARQARRP